MTFDTVCKIGLALPGVEEGTAYGSPALKVGGKMFVCIAINKSVEAHTLALRLPFDERDALIEEDPSTYYLKDHYVNYAVVLVRMSKVREDALRDLVRSSWRFVSAGPPKVRRAKAKKAQRKSCVTVTSPRSM